MMIIAKSKSLHKISIFLSHKQVSKATKNIKLNTMTTNAEDKKGSLLKTKIKMKNSKLTKKKNKPTKTDSFV